MSIFNSRDNSNWQKVSLPAGQIAPSEMNKAIGNAIAGAKENYANAATNVSCGGRDQRGNMCGLPIRETIVDGVVVARTCSDGHHH